MIQYENFSFFSSLIFFGQLRILGRFCTIFELSSFSKKVPEYSTPKLAGSLCEYNMQSILFFTVLLNPLEVLSLLFLISVSNRKIFHNFSDITKHGKIHFRDLGKLRYVFFLIKSKFWKKVIKKSLT